MGRDSASSDPRDRTVDPLDRHFGDQVAAGSELILTVVRYEDEPDRGTIHPPDAADLDRMETWISADLSAFVARPDWR